MFNMYQATAHSVNTYFAQLAMDVGIERGIEAARKMGISVPPRGSKDYDDHWNVCSSVLGVVPVSVLDMASAYGVLANNGVRCPAFSIARINGPTKKLFERRPDCDRAIEPKIASTVSHAPWGGDWRYRWRGRPARPPGGRQTGTAQAYQSAQRLHPPAGHLGVGRLHPQAGVPMRPERRPAIYGARSRR